MALTFGFYDSVNGDRTYNAREFSRFFDGILSDGVFEEIGDAFRVTAGNEMSVNVGIGRAWLKNTWIFNDSSLPVVITASEPILNRIDSVVLYVDYPTRTNGISVVKGTPASSPVAPALTNTAEHFEYKLANVYIPATATSIAAGNITNFVGTTGTPFVHLFPDIVYANETPLMDGTASVGTKKDYSRGDHRHPTDTSRAPVKSPTFTGTPTAPTATRGTNTTKIATTAFVADALSLKANLASPELSGTPTAPTATRGTNTTQIATTAFVADGLSLKANLASPTFTGTPKAPTAAAGTNTTQIATTAFVKTAIANANASKADLASPTFTGNPKAPTPADNDDDTSIATTAYVMRESAKKQAVKITKTATLSVAGWNASTIQQAVTVSGVTASNLVEVSPAPASWEIASAAGLYCLSQATNSLTFKCKNTPAAAITVNIVIWN